MNGVLTEDINWNTLLRIINNRQNSGELIKLPLKIINSVVFKYLYDFRELKRSLKVEFFSNRHLEFACIRNLCQQILLTD